jgi:DNA polymerase-3 subunit alpha
MKAVAISDHGNVYGVPQFLDATKQAGLKGIVGMETYSLWGYTMADRPPREEKPYHLCLFARNLEGYRNLGHIASQAHTRGFYYKPRVDLETLAKYSGGLIATSGCLQGYVAQCLLLGNLAAAREAVGCYGEIFGKENFFIEVQDHGIPEQKQILPELFRLADGEGIGAVATNDVHYVNQRDWEAHDALLCIQTGAKLSDEKRMRMPYHQFYLKSADEMVLMFKERPDALENTLRIAEMCSCQIPYGENHYPVFQMSEELARQFPDKAAYLKSLCKDGLERRYAINLSRPGERPGISLPYETDAGELIGRMEMELDVIGRAGFIDYFLVVQDFVNWAHRNDISVGPGRGSGAGSIVAYALHITDVDPLHYGLIFERFLNPERISPPDFDIDFCMRRRDEVVDYVREKYGRDGVANIITFGTFGAKMTLRDLLRVYDVPYGEANRISKMVPDEPGIDLSGAVERSSELRQEMEHNPILRKLIDQGKIIEGTVRNAGTHACGMVISDQATENFIPVTLQEGNLTTQYSKDYVEKLGLLKMDFLGLKTLTVIADAVQFIRRQKKDFSIEDIPLDDGDTYQLVNSGDNAGVFQLESEGMRSLCRQFGVHGIEDISDLSALYRPGPMEWIPDYIRRKRDPSSVRYAHPVLESVCKNTYGVLIYQEQVMQAARVVAGYSLGGADILRRAMGKKNAEAMNAQRAIFVEGAAETNGISEKKANEIFDTLEKFAGYGFNKSHSISYAILSYQTAYLKAHFPVEFFAAVLSAELGNVDKLSFFLAEAAASSIPVLGPDINFSNENFTPIPAIDGKLASIRFGLAAIKNVGESKTVAILKEREAGGPFAGFADFVLRMGSGATNRRTFENLILCGAFDSSGVDRLHLVNALDRLLKAKGKMQEWAMKNSSQTDLFTDAGLLPANPLESLIEVGGKTLPMGERLRYEKEFLGFYISGHPLDVFLGLERHVDQFPPAVEDMRDNQPFMLMGCIGEVTKKITKANNRLWAHAQLCSRRGDVQLNLFPDAYGRYGSLLEPGSIVVVRGTIRIQDDRSSYNVVEVIPAVSYLEQIGRQARFTVHGDDGGALREFLCHLAGYLAENEGPLPLFLEIVKNGRSHLLSFHRRLSLSLNLLALAPLGKKVAFQKFSICL